MKIAFIGLGNMGGGMAANLVKAGHEVRAFDLSEAAIAAAREHGCTTFASAAEACEGADAVVSMLPNGAIVKSVFRSEEPTSELQSLMLISYDVFCLK